jgi:hypothetical protein
VQAPQHALALELAQPDEPQRRAHQEGRRRVEIACGHRAVGDAERARGHAEGQRMVPGRATRVHLGQIAGEGGMGGQGARHPQRLATHLPARLAKLAGRLHRVQRGVERGAAGDVIRHQAAARGHRRGGVAGPRRAIELHGEEGAKRVGVGHAAVLTVGLETEGVRVAAGRERRVRQVQQWKEGRVQHHARQCGGGAAPRGS